jgi:hypothetical protein
VALVLALAIPIGIQMDQVQQVQMLMAMVVAQQILKMVGVVTVQVLGLDMAMPTPKFDITRSKVGANRPSLFEAAELFIFFVPLLHFVKIKSIKGPTIYSSNSSRFVRSL